MKRSLQHRTINRLAAFSVLGYAVQAAAHLVPPTNLHVSTTYNSFQYWFIRGEATWPQAADACQAVGGSLLSLSNADEALNTVWSPSVTEHSLQDSFWTGLTVSWPNGRRRMRSFALSKNIQTEIAPAIIHDEDSSRSSAGMETSGNALSYQSSGSGRRVPLSTGVNGRLVPDQVRQWQLLQERQGSRSLLGRKARARAGSDATDGDDRFNLKVSRLLALSCMVQFSRHHRMMPLTLLVHL